MPERDDDPLALVEDDDTGDRFLVYRAKDGVRVDLWVEGESFWATRTQMATMFGVTPQNITLHLKNLFADGELAEARARAALASDRPSALRPVPRRWWSCRAERSGSARPLTRRRG